MAALDCRPDDTDAYAKPDQVIAAFQMEFNQVATFLEYLELKYKITSKQQRYAFNITRFYDATVGYLDDNKERPVVVAYKFVEIFDKIVVFWSSTSQYSKADMCTEWLKKTFKNCKMRTSELSSIHHVKWMNL
jgi:hypothetical protein